MKEHGQEFRAAVLLFFLASGATGLILEVVWTRVLGTVFGNTVYAASAVLTTYMLGLAAGSLLLGRVADRIRRPLLLYGCLEIGVGLYAIAFPLLAAGSDAVYAWFYRSVEPGFLLLNAVRLPLSVLLLLPPTMLMGGTLPVLSRHLGCRNRQPGREVGYLYAVNTFGAVAGCFLAGFVLLEQLGVSGCLFLAGGVALGVGLLAAALGCYAERPVSVETVPTVLKKEKDRSRGRAKSPPRTAKPAQPVTAATFHLVMIAFGITGFCAMAYEVLLTRVLIFVLSTSVYAFATMLTAFLLGIAIGSCLSARFLVPRLRRPLLSFGVVEVLVGLSVLVSVALLARLERIDYWLSMQISFSGHWAVVLARFVDALAVLLVPALLMGAAFPIVAALCLAGNVPVGRRVGQIYAANTIGCVLGSFAAGFVLLPALGTYLSLLLVVALNSTVGVILVWQSMGPAAGRSRLGRYAVAMPVAALVVVAVPLTSSDVFHQTINAYHNPSEIVFVKEHSTGTVTVHDLPNGERLIAVCGVDVAGRDFMLRTTQKLQGYIPLCLHPNPRRVVQIGFGSGETTRVGLDFGVKDYTVVEICPAVFDAGEFFEELNHGSYRDPRVRKIIMDGKNFARLSNEKFDVVMNDSVYPGSSGSSALYTVDHFRNCRERLADGGLFSCWVPLDLRPTELRMILRSFQDVFPHTSLWVASNCLNKHALILGSLSPLRIDFGRLKEVVARADVAKDLDDIAIHNVYDLLDCHMCDAAAIADLVADDLPNTDDRPRLEFSCAVPISEQESLSSTLAMLAGCRTPITPYVEEFVDPPVDRGAIERRFEATTHIFHAQVAQLLGDHKVRRRQMELADALNPGEVHVATCRAELLREIADLQGALAERPGHTVLAMRLAEKLLMAGRDEEAGVLYEQLAEIRPPLSPKVLIHLGEIRFRLNRVEEAERAFQDCLAHWPDSAEAHDLLGGVYLRTGRLDPARRHSRRAVELAPRDSRYAKHHEMVVERIAGAGR